MADRTTQDVLRETKSFQATLAAVLPETLVVDRIVGKLKEEYAQAASEESYHGFLRLPDKAEPSTEADYRKEATALLRDKKNDPMVKEAREEALISILPKEALTQKLTQEIRTRDTRADEDQLHVGIAPLSRSDSEQHKEAQSIIEQGLKGHGKEGDRAMLNNAARELLIENPLPLGKEGKLQAPEAGKDQPARPKAQQQSLGIVLSGSTPTGDTSLPITQTLTAAAPLRNTGVNKT